jgi:predicted transcriptional regulator of viral defense system
MSAVPRTLTEARLQSAGIGAFFRPRDVRPLGVAFRALQGLVAAGEVEKVGEGHYRLVAVEPTELETVAMVGAAIPSGIVCLLTALSVHDIGTQSPHEVWMAIDRKARRPTRLPARVRLVRFSAAMLTYGVVTRLMLGVPVKITSPARTVVDCFRYRNKVGIDVAMEALRDAVRSRKATVDAISRAAEICHARTVIGPYLEALSV